MKKADEVKVKKIIGIVISIMLCADISSHAASEEAKRQSPATSSASQQSKQSSKELYKQVELFTDALSIVKDEYVDDVEPKKIMYGAIGGMLSSLDDFSEFMTPEDYKEIKEETKGEFGGVGIEISVKDGILSIITPVSGSPADLAGIEPGDKIIKINGEITKNISLPEAVKKMRGAPGTSLTLTIWREKGDLIFDRTITRAIIKVASVKRAELIDGAIGYVKLIEFQESTAGELESALKKLEAQGMTALVLDLRNNPGGLLDGAVDAAEKFLKKGELIVSIHSRTQKADVAFSSRGKYPHPDYPIVVIVNQGSASAAEIVAGALQDDRRAIIVGTKTYGKASVQTVIPLKDGSALKLTTASYLTPRGRLIRGMGIAPDVVVEREALPAGAKEGTGNIFDRIEAKKNPPPQEQDTRIAKPGEKIDIEKDNQLSTAISILKTIKGYSPGKK